MAAQSLGLEQVPCIRLGHLTEAQRRAYVIADNQLALNSGWDEDMLKAELQDLQELDFNIDVIGFDMDELNELMFEPTEEQTHEDAIPKDIPVTSKPGDLWLMGKHRLICGSSTNADDVSRVLNGAIPHLMVTDPPYGIEYDPEWRNSAIRNDGTPIGGRAVGKVLNDDNADWREAWALFPGDVAESLASCGFEPRALIIWAKSQLVIGRGHYHPQHEPCWYVVKKGKTGHWEGGRKKTTLWRNINDIIRPDEEVYFRKSSSDTIHAISGDESTIWEIPKPMKSETGHSTQKPVECMRRPILNNSKRLDIIYEPFCGSGTTVIAAEQTGRICYAVELGPDHVDRTVKRWQDFTGKQAMLEATGQTFDELTALRT